MRLKLPSARGAPGETGGTVSRTMRLKLPSARGAPGETGGSVYRRPTNQTLVLTTVIATIAAALFAFSRPAEMRVDGVRIDSDVPPVTTSSNVYVPLRSVADALGAETTAEGDKIYVTRDGHSLRLRVGDVHATVNGMPLTLKHAPFRVRGRVMIGLKNFASAFGVQAYYDPRTARVDMITPGVGTVLDTEPTPAAE